MPEDQNQETASNPELLPPRALEPFRGFEQPRSNTTYTPNQFFDVCLPYYSRGVVRLVGYMIRQTLGWCDADGHPQNEGIQTSYQELIEHAGIGRTMIRQVIDEAVAGNFIRCVQAGRPKGPGQSAVTAAYELRWDGQSGYVKEPGLFKGFFEGQGNRTDIPNQFFDQVIPNETLSVIKVVGSIIRFSLGFQTQRGCRRQQVALSYKEIQNYVRIRSPATLGSAIHQALDRNYVLCVESGVFDPNAGNNSKAATYSLRWIDSVPCMGIGSETVAGESKGNLPDRRENSSDDRFENHSGDQFGNRSGIGSKSVAEDRFENRSDIKMKQTNETYKQQQQVAAVEYLSSYEQLRRVGFGEEAAIELAANRSAEHIENQIEWLKRRVPKRNPLGLLRRAIEEDWPEPAENIEPSRFSQESEAGIFAKRFYAGYGGNQGEPTAEPSRSDLEASERYVKRLCEIWPDPTQVAGWGRALGRLTREQQTGNRNSIVSLVLALRSYGDQFFIHQRSARQASLERARAAARPACEARFRSAWLKYVLATEQRFRRESAEEYAAFEAHRASQRQEICVSPWNLVPVERALACFDSEEQRLVSFQEFFRSEVLDFWKWDKEQNLGTSPGEPSA